MQQNLTRLEEFESDLCLHLTLTTSSLAMEKDNSPSEKQALLEQADESDDNVTYRNVGCCHPGSTGYRYAVLVFLCLAGIGRYMLLKSPYPHASKLSSVKCHLLLDIARFQ